MSQQLVIKTKEFDLANVNYSEPKANNSGGKNIFLNYKNPKTGRFQPLILQSPKLKICYGVKPIRQRLPNDKPGTPGSGPIIKYEVSFSFGKLDDQHPKNNAFYEVFNGLDEKIVNDSVDHSVEWMGKPRNRASVDLMQELYTGSVRWSIDRETKERNTKWPPTCKAKIPYWDGKFDTKNFQIFDAESKPVDISKYGVIYAAAHKNFSTSGVCYTIIRKDLIQKSVLKGIRTKGKREIDTKASKFSVCGALKRSKGFKFCN